MHNITIEEITPPLKANLQAYQNIAGKSSHFYFYMFPNRRQISFGRLQDLVIGIGDLCDLFLDAEGFN